MSGIGGYSVAGVPPLGGPWFCDLHEVLQPSDPQKNRNYPTVSSLDRFGPTATVTGKIPTVLPPSKTVVPGPPTFPKNTHSLATAEHCGASPTHS